MNPIQLLNQIKQLYITIAKLNAGETVAAEYIAQLNCNDVAEINIALKIIGFVVFVMIVVTFSSKLHQSAQDYKIGLYNSKLYYESKCASQKN